MAINPEYIGKTFPPGPPYEVSRVKLAEFADAIGDPNPVYRDRAAAAAAGYPDVIAPPTFPIVIGMAASGQALADPGLNLNYAMVVHGEQRFEYSRPLVAGDVVTATVTIADIRQAGRNSLMTTSTRIETVGGEHVCTAFNTLVERGGAQ
ncbi:MAG: MaoC family dehydratase N-terminal domain-containing protein [Actinomycetota bacterium]|jgi:acyl dehydratase|nr:MaoC family dehydratase N-terminal domain-containing protein [Actinomycetota bacterium]